MTTESSRAGQVITFYSYKGGTGRSMALANVACLLASRAVLDGGKPVLAIDWDLEAPGLDRYLERLMSAPAFDHPGLLDLFTDLRERVPERVDDRDELAKSLVESLDLQRYVIPIQFPPQFPTLHFLRAGRIDHRYAERVNTFPWTAFYEAVPSFFRLFAQRLAKDYSFVLIDSRTGVTDTSGICTTLMPEKLVVVFTPNRQSLTGVTELIHRADAYRRSSRDPRPLTAFPLPSRIDTSFPDLMKTWRMGDGSAIPGWQKEFISVLEGVYDLDESETSCLEHYFDEVQMPHVAQYAFGEPVAVLDERVTDKLTLANSYAALRDYLLRGAPWLEARTISTDEQVELHRKIASLEERIGTAPAPPAPLLEPPRIAPTRLSSATLMIGRERELAMLDAAWNGDPKTNVVTIVGFGGVGKSTLAAHWAATKYEDVERYFDWSFHRQGSSDVFLKAALEFFGDVALAASAAEGWQKGERLAQLVAQHRTLLILDGLEPLQDARTGELRDPALASLLRALAARNRGLCVVTTRQEIPDLDTFRSTTAPQWKLASLSKEAGASLLENFGVRGTATERETLASDVKGHALTLTLLGKFLAEAHDGDIRRRDLVSLREADFEETSGHAFRMMEAYEEWLARDGRHVELAILRLLGLFDRPATPDCLGALRAAPAVGGLTDALVPLTDTQWNLAVKRLVQLGFVEEQPWEPPRIVGYSEEEAWRMIDEGSRAADAQPPQISGERRMDGNALDAHPLIREHFARRLRESAPEVWRAVHGRLYEHLRDSVPYWPEAVDGLQPLYQAVVHGCQAGRATETCEQVYQDRILRGTSGPYAFYSMNMLGLAAADLAAVRCFFTVPWRQLTAELTAADQSWLLTVAAFQLRALGRLDEAREPMRAGLEADVALEDWKNAAISAGNLSELDLTLGDVASAVRHAEQSVQYADRSGDVFERMSDRTTHADVLHQAGRVTEAGERFREAEMLQRERNPTSPLLYSLSGFRFCDLLLAGIARAAWRRSITSDEQPFDAQILADVEHRAETALAIAMRDMNLLGVALDNLTLGRAALFRAVLDGVALDRAQTSVAAAVRGLRQAGQADELPRALLTRAWLRALERDPAAARADLDEAQQLAERGPMRLHLADVHLHRARLFFRENLDDAREELKKARALIERCGYHRRDEELHDAERVLR